MNIHASRARAVRSCFLQNTTGNPKVFEERLECVEMNMLLFPLFSGFYVILDGILNFMELLYVHYVESF